MPNALEAVDPMVVTLGRHVEDHLSDMARARFGICLSEALTNLVIHAPTEDREAPIDIFVVIGPDQIEVAVFDPKGAPPFDVRDHGRDPAQMDALAESGRGLGLIMECADRVDYGPGERGNRLLLGFDRPG